MNYKYLVFDLDNTLYPKKSGMLKAIDERIDSFIRESLDIPAEEITKTRFDYWKKYGTTLGGLIIHHNINPKDYFNYIYQLEPKDYIGPDPVLREILKNLSMNHVVFSNSPREYIGRVLDVLEISDLIQKIYDIKFLRYLGKPNLTSYSMVLQDLNTSGNECIMFEDTVANALGAQEAGMTAVLVGEEKVPEIKWHIREIRDLSSIIPKIIKSRITA